ncbi:MAG: Gfo/Idh/MocA family oxidoreductase [Planctomycetes bacterium]|nr:Gfo/Idh/MocA family oxidoreductase [Planctomycetota bacterium]
MSTGRSFTRRTFLRRSAAAGFPLLIASRIRGADAPSERIAIGCIGMGSHGVHRNLNMLLRQPDARVVAVCDVFDERWTGAQSLVEKQYGAKGCEGFRDFRRIIERKDIDCVMISTPDHWHVLMSVLAMREGKDVICEKPTYSIEEGRILADTVKARRAVYQTSTEDRSMPCYHRMAQIVRNGRIGKVRSVQVRLPSGNRFPDEEAIPVPKGLDYDLWLGPAPFAPYTANRTELNHWRQIRDYSGGLLTDWGMHQLDTVQWALDKERTGPVEVEGTGEANLRGQYNTFSEYDLTYRYADGIELRIRSGGTSIRIEGTDGWVGNEAFAAPIQASSPEIAAWLPGEGDVKLYTNPGGEHRDFVDCVKSRKDPYFPAEVGHRCSSLLHIGNIAMLLGRKLRWDPEKEAFIDDREADEMRGRPMRAPWSLKA